MRLSMFLVLAVLALAVTASSGAAAGPARTPILGVVPHAGQAAPAVRGLSRAIRAAAPTTLTFDASYEGLINRYFTDVAHDSGGTSNVYSVGTQYSDGSGHVQYKSTVGGSYVSHDPLPPNGCNDGTDPYCLTDSQLRDEIQSAMAAKGWQGSLSHMFFLMTPYGVGSCENSIGNNCSTNVFCAYHSAFGPSANQAIIYANEPYLGPSGGCIDPTQGFPNDVDSDTTINTISHEHNEAITDPLGDAWVGSNGIEDGDLCAYGFGTQIGGTPGVDAYNQVINTHHYDLQQEYSNQAPAGCEQFLGGPSTPPTTGQGPLPYDGGPVMHTNTTYAIYWLPTPGSTSPPALTGTAAVNRTLTSSPGSWNGGPTSYSYRWQRCSSVGTNCVDIPGATTATYKPTPADLHDSVRSTVRATNVNGASPLVASAASAAVIDVPTAKKAPHIAGRPRVGKKVSASHGSWTYSPTGYRYQWLRCNARGGACIRISHATQAAYKLTKRDAKHRIRVRVTAANAAGSKTATSRATARVPAARAR